MALHPVSTGGVILPSNFSIGDVVGLKSGGPSMMVINIDHKSTGDDPQIHLAWINNHGDMTGAQLPARCLQKRVS